MIAKEPLQKGTCHKSMLSRHSYGDEAASVHLMMMIMVIIMAMMTVVLVIVGVVMLSMKQLSQQL